MGYLPRVSDVSRYGRADTTVGYSCYHGMVCRIPSRETGSVLRAIRRKKRGEPVQKGAGKGRRVQDRNPKLLCRPQYEGCGANGYNGSVLNADTVFVA